MADLIEEMDSIIERFTVLGKDIIKDVAFPYGTMEINQFDTKSNKLSDDYQFFAFTKSTKTLISIKCLLELNQNEDVLNLNRSIFENYLSSRYFQENANEIDGFIVHPLGLSFGHYYTNFNVETKNVEIMNREKEVVGCVKNPSSFKIGKDKKYFTDFYNFLCKFTHCNYGVNECFTEDNGLYTIDRINYEELSRLISIFTFSKIFENVVTVEGEDFPDDEYEERCYQLVRDSKQLQEKVFKVLIERYQIDEGQFYRKRNKNMRDMLKAMKSSLKEEVGSVKNEEW